MKLKNIKHILGLATAVIVGNIQALADILSAEQIENLANNTIVKLDLSRKGLSGYKLDVLEKNLLKYLRENTSLEELNLGENYLKSDIVIKIVNLAVELPKLRILNLANNYIDSAGANRIFEILREKNKTIRSLNLSNNWTINGKGLENIGDFLRENRILQSLNLDSIRIRHDVAMEIARSLDGNETLQELSLCFNNIDEAGASALIDVWERNETFTTLDLSGSWVLSFSGKDRCYTKTESKNVKK